MTDYDKLKAILSDRWQRLSKLYWITDKEGNTIKFVPNEFQVDLYDNLWNLNVILKARQLGMSTFIVLFMLDVCLFNSNMNAGIIDATLPDAKKKLKKAKFAYDRLPIELQNSIKLVKDNEQELRFSNGSVITADTTFRGDTLQLLHISEYAKICKTEPIKAEEIRTGALNAVAKGQTVFIESTAEDGEGHFFDLCKRAEELQKTETKLTELDYKFHFFPWWKNEEYELAPLDQNYQTKDEKEYFDTIGVEIGQELCNSKCQWYIKKSVDQKSDMKREYPSSSREAFESSTEDKYYREALIKMKAETPLRICEFPIEQGIEVDIDMDLGRRDYTSIIFSQTIAKELHIVDFLEEQGEALPFYIEAIKKLGYMIGTIWLPHDANNDLLSSEKNVCQQVIDFGYSAELVPKLAIETGINEVRKLLPRCWFRKSTTHKLLRHLEGYSKKWSRQLGVYTGPKHDEHSHAADAFRGLAVRYMDQTKKVENRVQTFKKKKYGY